jgi:hypothetical protein
MPDERDEDEATRHWIVEPPPAPGEVSLYVAFGDGVELTQEQQVALNGLLRSLESRDLEVVGHDGCYMNQLSCTGLSCTKVSCSWLDCNKMGQKVANTAAANAGSWALLGSFGPSNS